MSTLSTIQTGSGNDTLSGEQDTVLPTANTPAGLVGLFEELIAKAVAPDSNEKTPLKEQHQQTQNVETPNAPKPSAFAGPSQKSKSELDAATAILNFSMAQSGKVESATVSKSAAKSGTGTSGTDNNSSSQSSAIPMADVSTIEMLAEQMLAAAFPAMNQVVKSNAETLAAASKSGPTIKSAAIPAIPSQANPNAKAATSDATTPGTATKISAADLSANQAPAAVSAFTPQKAISFAANEAGASATRSETAQIDTATTDSSKENSSPGQDNSSSKDSHPDISTVAQLQSLANGTSIAKQDMAMQQAEKMNKFAGQTEKVLPGEGFSAAHTNPASLLSPDAAQAATSAAAAASSVGNAGAASILPTDSVAVPVSTDMRTRTLERTQELVTVNATRLNELGNSSMQVVIKPDAGTQLSLELRQQGNGAVEVQAVLQQGDFNHLNQQWSDLQHSLEQRGIKLAPLTDDATAFANTGGSETYQNKQNQTTEGIPQITLNTPAGIASAAGSAPEAKQASTYRGWETWA